MMFLDIFQEVDNEHLECLEVYGTPTAIPQWNRWHKMSKKDYYCLLFKCTRESAAGLFPEAIGLYYYIEMDLNVDATAARSTTTPPKKDSKPLSFVINVATGEDAKTMDMGGDPPSM
ncbi:hypothetical protein C0993_010751 [Termitomyces sp. T159_Od127]|nr:hypothetical protein C0993_010751 [Termitomyces sp. T159_Od127]